MMEYEKSHPFLGFTFDRIGGDRVFLCRNCDRTFEVGTGSHGVSGLSRGYQCQACGKCDTRYYEEPFAELGYELPKELTSDELASVRRSRDEAHAAYQASLVCECGGPLDRDKVLFCPGCRSKELEILARLERTTFQDDPVLGFVPVIEGNRLHHNGARYRLRVALLETYLQQYRPGMRFCWNDESSARGYNGTWEIKDGRLYLTHLAEFTGRARQHHPTIGPDVLRDRFPQAGEDGLFADRFSGLLHCPYGAPLHFLEPGFASICPHELILGIENGVLVSEEVKDAAIPPAGYPRRQAA